MSVATSWARIVGWLASNHPASIPHINPPATAVDLRYLQAAMNRPLPVDLVDFLQIANGTNHRYIYGYLIPSFYNLVPVMEMLSTRTMMREIDGRVRGVGPWPDEGEPAGRPPMHWLDALLPIADAYGGGHLYVDLRDGDQFGCVGQWDEGFASAAPYWGSVGEMLADVASALADGRPALQVHADGATRPGERIGTALPHVTDGYLHWGDIPA
ncbi:hypothetical protein E1263_31005 [Kribbella antibiotica]|uniref:Knr4/Smi1-like domain-containing protein n=1 Tax=Kribbella antibiotica TaxID=190195 RepID=A0A4R4Z115_9ACTN|nr:SMI1/KNR4 family protein [Kribbella antibiotica]TDD50489.1 hypothetical protein E1263_31005 [Kribbella antibiotica]